MRYLLFLCLVLTACAKSKNNYVLATGTVRDFYYGKDIPNAWVYIWGPGNQVLDSARANAAGQFAISANIPGDAVITDYSVSVVGPAWLYQSGQLDYIPNGQDGLGNFYSFQSANSANRFILPVYLTGYLAVHVTSDTSVQLATFQGNDTFQVHAPVTDTVLWGRCVPYLPNYIYVPFGSFDTTFPVKPNPGDTTVITLHLK